MKTGDKQLGRPQILYKDTKANIEALTGVLEGGIAYATDTDEIGTYNGSAWNWLAWSTMWSDRNDPTGFINRTTSTLSFNAGTREVTISPTGTNFSFYSAGVKYTKTAQTKQIDNTNGLHYVYFDTSGVIQKTTDPWDINSAAVPVACVYWNGTAGILYDERHGIQMDGMTQEYLHETRGSAFASGMAGTFAANGSTITIGAGEWYDEDIEHITTEQTTCRIFYLNSTVWNWTSAQAPYYHVVSSVPQYNNSGALADVDTAKFSVSWVYMTNATSTPVAVIMGQAQYNTQALAEAATLPNLATLPGPEMILLYRVIWQRDGAIISWKRTDDYRRVLSGPATGYIATDHGALAGLNDADHPASAITLDTTNFDNNLSGTDTTVQAALETLDELVAAGTADGISVSTTNFDNNLSAADDTVQKALETLDELAASGEGGYYEPITTGDVDVPELVFADGDIVMATGSPSAFGVAPTDGWNEVDETWTYASADDPTYSFTVPGDKTGKYYAGARVRLTQTTVKYFIITKVAYAAPNTTVTIYGGTDYDLANATITSPYHSVMKAPAGFPLSPLKWTVTLTDTSERLQSTPTNEVWYNPGSISISIPIGLWSTEWSTVLDYSDAGGLTMIQIWASLSTSNNSESDKELSAIHVLQAAPTTSTLRFITTMQIMPKVIDASSKTTYYFIIKTNMVGQDYIEFRGDLTKTIIRAVCAYL